MNDDRHLLETLEPELLDAVGNRRTFLSRGAKAALALGSVPVGLAFLTREALASQALPQGIVDVLNFALTLEYLEAEFYTMGAASAELDLGDYQDVAETLRDHENAHVALLQTTLGGDAVEKPEFDFTAEGTFPDVFTNAQTFLAVSQAFEDTGVRAYKGGAAALMSNDAILTTALQIHSVEARHASVIRRIRGRKGWITGDATDVAQIQAVYDGEDNTTHAGVDASTTTSVGTNRLTEAFDEPLTMAQVLAIVDPFIVN